MAGLLESSLANASVQQDSGTKTHGKDTFPPESHTLLDLLITLSSHLPMGSLPQLFALASRIITTSNQDPHLIKKAYRLIPRLANTGTGITALQARHSELQSLFLQTTNTTPPAARYPRLLALNSLISTVPTTDLHFVPSILSEVVLACRSTSDKARQTAFSILIKAVEVVSAAPPGTVIRNSQVPGMSSSAPDALAGPEEVFTMVSAGLAGGAPSVVAATCTALGRLLFEFHTKLSVNVLGDLVDTVAMFLESNSREIVRAVLGFVKVAVVVLSDEVLKSKGAELVRRIVPWCKEHKGRLRAKVKGILDRMMRRLSAEECDRWVAMVENGTEDGRKLVRSIRKERERRKKKKGAKDKADEESDEDERPGKGEFNNEFDKAVYGSDDNEDLSELGSGDDDTDTVGVSFHKNNHLSHKRRGKNRKTGEFIREDVDGNDDEDVAEPLDLLAPEAIARISSRKTFTRPRITKARVNEDGKLVFGGGGDSETAADKDKDARNNADVGGGGGVDAYVEAVSGPDAVRRGQRGRLKVKQKGDRRDRGRDQNRDRMDVDDNGDGTDNVRKEAGKVLNKQTQRRGLGAEKRRSTAGGSGIIAGGIKKKGPAVMGKGRVAKKKKIAKAGGFGKSRRR